MTVRAIRGATQLDRDDREHLFARSAELVQAVLDANRISADALISILFTCSPDLRSDFPAAGRPPDGACRPARRPQRGAARVPARCDGAATGPGAVTSQPGPVAAPAQPAA